MKQVEFDIEEYRALRTEVIQSKDEGNKILAFGLAAIGLIVGAILSNKNTQMSVIVLVFFLPVLSSLVLSMWFAAQERMARASFYLTGVERRIKGSFDNEDGVSWEAWLRARNPQKDSEHFWHTETAGISLFIIIILCCFLMGLMIGSDCLGWKSKGVVISVSLIVCGYIIINILRRYKKWKFWLNNFYDPSQWENKEP